MKRTLLAALAVFVLWTILDMVIHAGILGSAYAATAELWRPQEDMKMVLMRIVVALSAFVFAYLYATVVTDKSMSKALTYGFLIGFSSGLGMGYGTYAVMPIPYHMALTWFLGTVVETTAAGALLGWILKK